ncbi:MAG TPA: aminotransferase class IV [Methylomirabilota bacterium]|nr:aminotransferase class IV [Methylomirabilota bacterium]
MSAQGGSPSTSPIKNLVALNGEILPADQARVSVFDRAFTYGDGLFEAVRIHRGKLFAWSMHLQRCQRSANELRLTFPLPAEALARSAAELIALSGINEGMLRMQLSRGVGARGYSSKGANSPLLVMTVHELPAARKDLRVITSSYTLPPLSHHKTCNRLINVLARDESDEAGCDDALFLTAAGHIAEATTANVFWFEGNTLCTPALSTGCLPGVTRQILLDLWGASPKMEVVAPLERLLRSDGVFLSLTTAGLVEVAEINKNPLPRSCAAADLQEAYLLHLERECS